VVPCRDLSVLLYRFGVHSTFSSKNLLVGEFLKVLNFNWLFFKLGWFICDYVGIPISEGGLIVSVEN
jgi:hypothetical protein